jgi:hypothetical protein
VLKTSGLSVLKEGTVCNGRKKRMAYKQIISVTDAII